MAAVLLARVSWWGCDGDADEEEMPGAKVMSEAKAEAEVSSS